MDTLRETMNAKNSIRYPPALICEGRKKEAGGGLEPNTYDRQLTQIRQAYLQAYPLPVGNRHLIPTPIMILLRKKAEPRRSHERERERARIPQRNFENSDTP